MGEKIDTDIRNGTFERVYCLYGEEEYLTDYNKKRLIRAILPEGDELNLNVWRETEIDADQLIAQAQTLPFFAEHRLIVVEQAGLLKKSSASEAIAKALPTFPEETILIITEKEKPDSRSMLFQVIKKMGYLEEFRYLKDERMENWILRKLEYGGRKIQRSAMKLLMERISDDMRSVSMELDKLIAYTMGKDAIYLEDVQAVTTIHLENRIFEMTDAIAAKNVQGALERYEELLALKESPMGILGMLFRQFDRLLKIKELRNQGLDQTTIGDQLQMKGFLVRKSLGQVSNFTYEELRMVLELLARADSDIKSGRMQDVLAAELVIIAAAS